MIKFPRVTGCELDPLFESMPEPVVIPVDIMPELPSCFELTVIGDPKSSLRQYRCIHGYHAREYSSFYEVHRDRFDPRRHPIAHLLLDTEAGGLMAKAALLAAVWAYANRRHRRR